MNYAESTKSTLQAKRSFCIIVLKGTPIEKTDLPANIKHNTAPNTLKRVARAKSRRPCQSSRCWSYRMTQMLFLVMPPLWPAVEVWLSVS